MRNRLYTQKDWLEATLNITKSTKQIALMCGVSKNTIRRWITMHHISRDCLYLNYDFDNIMKINENRGECESKKILTFLC